MGHHVRAVVGAAAHPGRRVGQEGPAQRGRQGGGGPGVRVRGLAAHDHAVGLGSQPLRHPGHDLRVERGGGTVHLGPGPPVRAARPHRGIQVPGLGRQRRAQREVEVHRPGPAPGRRVHGAARQGAVVHRGGPRRIVRAHLHEPLGRRAEQAQLIDRLARAHVAQLGRAIRGEHDQGGGGLTRLGHRRMKVGRGRARGAGHGHGPARGARHPEGHEPRRPLVDHGDALDVSTGGQRQDDRRVARARAGHGVADAAAGQLLHEGFERREGPVQGRHGGARYSTRRRLPA